MRKCKREDTPAEPLNKKQLEKSRMAIRESINKEGKMASKEKKEVKRMVDHKAMKESPIKKMEKSKLKSKLKVIKTKDGY